MLPNAPLFRRISPKFVTQVEVNKIFCWAYLPISKLPGSSVRFFAIHLPEIFHVLSIKSCACMHLCNINNLHVFQTRLFKSINCRGHHLGQSFASSGCGRWLLQDEDLSRCSRQPFPGSCYMCSGTSPEKFRSGPDLTGPWESRQDVITRLICGFLSYWTLEKTSLWLFPQNLQKIALCSLLMI